jgi:DNA processing protein
MSKDIVYLEAFSRIPGLGPQKMRLLKSHFSDFEIAWKANLNEFIRAGLKPELVEKIINFRQSYNLEKEWEKLAQNNIRTITIHDSDYPQLLKEIPSAPYLIYTKGSLTNLNLQPMIAIVGSRKFTSYGRQVAESIARDLAVTGIIIVSGLAIGIDAFAHQGALDGKGQTVAVLGNSLEDGLIAPRSNFALAKNIIRSGCLLSDYPPGTGSLPQNFPARNRLMAGMTLGTVVIEAEISSGSLITAKLALEFNREVFAVPGSVFSPASAGTHQLIKSGAKLVASAADILEELNLEKIKNIETAKLTLPATPEEKILLNSLSAQPTHIDTIIKNSKLETSAVSATLSLMEMKGMVKNMGGQNYIII